MPLESVAYVPIYLFTYVGLLLTPLSLKKNKWLFLVWFFLVNVFMFTGLWKIHIAGMRLPLLAFSQLPAVGMLLYLLHYVHHKKIEINPRAWVRWSIFRLIGVYYLLILFSNELPLDFVAKAAFFEIIIGLWAVGLSFGKKNLFDSVWFVAWNTLGLVSSLVINFQIRYWAYFGEELPQRFDLILHFNRFPEMWLSLYWVPLSICIHLVLFYCYLEHRIKGRVSKT